MPFIQGPRNCLGQFFALLEARVVLALLVKVTSMPARCCVLYCRLSCRDASDSSVEQTVDFSTCCDDLWSWCLQRFKFRNVRRDAGERHPLVSIARMWIEGVNILFGI